MSVNSPPERPGQGDLYDTERWESAYRDLHSTPTLLIQLQDEVSRSRLREAFWISVIFHLLVVIAIVNSDSLAKLFPRHKVVLVTPVSPREKEVTFLALPPDAEKLNRRPNSDIISDKDRIAMSKKPRLDPEELRKILTPPPGPPRPAAPPQSSSPQKMQPATPPVVAQSPAQPAHQGQPAPPPVSNNQAAKLQSPPAPKSDPFAAAKSTSSQLAQAVQGVAERRGGGNGGAGGDYGLSRGNPTAAIGPLDVLSDTMGVNFGPYLKRVLDNVRDNWYTLIPESARLHMKKGKVTIEFAILKDGTVAGMTLAGKSGDESLDRAAWGGISSSNPFPPLPAEYGGQYLGLRFHFLYNPDQGDLLE